MSRPLTKSWIDSKLSRAERERLVEYLLERTASPTGAQILDAIGELFPQKSPPSVRALNDWKSKSWGFELRLRDMRAEAGLAKLLGGDSADFGAGNKKLADFLVFKSLSELRDGGEADKSLHALILSAARLGKLNLSERETAAKLEVAARRLDEYRRKDEERAANKAKALETLRKNKDGLGLSKEAIEAVEEQLKLF